LLIGLGVTAISALEALCENFEVIAVVRSLDADSSEIDPVIAFAASRDLPISHDTSMSGVRSLIETAQPDCVVVSSYHRILPADLLEKSQFINVHYAPLPEYRGRANVNWALINGEKYAGVSIHRMIPGLDGGPIFYQEKIEITEQDTITTLYGRLNAIQRRELGGAVTRLLSGEEGSRQDESLATYCCTRLPEDGQVDWELETATIDRLIRALTPPYPGAYTWFEGRRLTIWAATPVVDGPRYVGRVPGRVVAVSKAMGSVDVLTGDGALRIFEIQRDGEPKTAAASLIKSVKATLGLRISDLLKRIEDLEAKLLKTQHES
jgi:methionyl-tRNA formyltransferase